MSRSEERAMAQLHLAVALALMTFVSAMMLGMMT